MFNYSLLNLYNMCGVCRHRQKIETLEQSHSSQIMELNREIVALENKLAVEKAATDAEKRKNQAMSQEQQHIEDSGRLTPSTSIEQDSVDIMDSIWPVISVHNNYNFPSNFG